MACEHPTHSYTCNCGYKILPHSDHAIAKDKERERNEAELAIREKWRGATYSEAYNNQMMREELNQLRRK